MNDKDTAPQATFADLDLPAGIQRAAAANGFEQPTPIQVEAIPLIRAGRDVAAEAQTGSGKTAAFVLPIVAWLSEHPSPDERVVRALVLAPTRELAQQVASTFKTFAYGDSCRVLTIIGGVSVDSQLDMLRSGVDVVVATPGRLLDILERGALDLKDLETLVLDEADKLLDLGFREELADLIRSLPKNRQTLFFTATLPQHVRTLGSIALRAPVTIRIDADETTPPLIEQQVYETDSDNRRPLLQHLVRDNDWRQTLVFVSTQRAAENLARKLHSAGFATASLHGGLEQAQRDQALSRFKRGMVSILVATDLAGRGIDVPSLDAVVNYDLPRSPQTYVHRIGRTGRAGETGVAISFVDHESELHFRLIEKRMACPLPRTQLPEFPLTGQPEPRRRGAGPPPKKGKRKSKKDKLRKKGLLPPIDSK
ncbi:MAG: DEAD/DEAH box helicase [Polyangiales bacterium]